MKELKMLVERQVKVGAMMPGAIRLQYSVCGKEGCACKNKNNPRKHGPYNQLSFSTKGKSSTMFIKNPDLKTAEEMTEAYKLSRSLTQEIALAVTALCRNVGIKKGKQAYEDLYEQASRRQLGLKLESAKLKEANSSKVKWKEKAVERKSEIEKLRIKIRDLTKSRCDWKEKATLRKKENLKLNDELGDIKKNFGESS